ncbi:unnamed protein product [Adineta ricciae]|uniref:Cullin N-terminal domain-containing protein n=1 Tax=Adineta ricciae TaxID=249248 RepID=A0A814STE7_ADIRI|nr:unnamed protein product [Adineta ricciae]
MTEGYSFLRFLHRKYTEEEYINEAWTPINGFLRQCLQNTMENCQSTSYETIYHHIYTTTCKGYKERLFTDIKKVINEHCQNTKLQLDESMKKMIDERSTRLMNCYILQFIDHARQFHRAIELIIPFFHYLDVVYIKSKLRTTIRQEFYASYKAIVIECHINQVFNTLQQLVQSSEGPSKEIIGLLLKFVHDIAPDLAVKQRHLLKRYCNNEDVFNEITSNGNDTPTPTSRNASKRSVDELPGDEDQPSAKRTSHMLKSPRSDN